MDYYAHVWKRNAILQTAPWERSHDPLQRQLFMRLRQIRLQRPSPVGHRVSLRSCKKRTGSAYGLSVVMEKSAVKSFVGDVKTFLRKGDSGNAVEYDFCPKCGTTIRWRLAVMPSREVYALGTIDDPGQFEIDGEYYVDSALPAARLGCDLVCPAAPDNTFRETLVERRKRRVSP